MDPAARLYADSLLKLMLRSGVIDEAAALAMADEHDLLASRNPGSASDHQHVAHLLRLAVLDHGPPPAVDPRVEFEADFRRRQMRERTAILAKERGE